VKVIPASIRVSSSGGIEVGRRRQEERVDPVLLEPGAAEKIWLPDGSLFVSAGWIDFVDHPDATFVLSPDRGNPGNVAGFCAALAP